MPKLKELLVLLLAVLPTYLLRFAIGPIPSTVLEVLVLFILAIWFFREQGYRMDWLRSAGPYRAPLLLLLSASCFAVAVSPNLFSALGAWKAFYIEPILLFFVFRSTFKTRDDWTMALGALGISVISIACFAIFQRITGMGIPIPWDVELRATSFFDFPNAAGLFVGPAAAAFAVLAFDKTRQTKERIFFAIAAVFGLITVFLSQTEALYVAIPIALLGTFLMSSVPKNFKLSVLTASILLGALAFAGSHTVREKLLLQDLSGQVRQSQWHETVAMLHDHPVFGAGLQGYPTVFAKYHDPQLYEIFQYPHNILLNFWVELGLLGVIALIAFVIAVTRTAYARRENILVLAAFAALLTMCIHGLVDVPFFKNDLAILTAFFLAMTCSSTLIQARTSPTLSLERRGSAGPDTERRGSEDPE